MTDIIDENIDTKLSKGDELDERRRRIHALHNRGVSYKEIAEQENVSIATVKRDLSIALTDSVKEVKNYNREQYLANTIVQYDDIWGHCWKIYNAHKDDPELQLKALTAARLTLNDKRKALQDTGVVKKDLQLSGLQVNMNLVAGMSDEEIRKITTEIIERQALTTELQLPEPEDDIEDAVIVEESILEPTPDD